MSKKAKGIFFICVFVLAISVTDLSGSEQQNNNLRTIEFETSEVTQASVTLSPDGEWLVFTILGHLFRLPVEGGTAEQLTFGPYYDSDPLFSPDGTRICFVSDRDGSESNIFVLNLKSRQITQVTHEQCTDRPIWTPDSQAIVYLELDLGTEHSGHGPTAAQIRRKNLFTKETITIIEKPRYFRSLFFLPDGRLGWTVLEGRYIVRHENPNLKTHIEVMDQKGTVTSLHVVPGIIDRVVANTEGNGIYCRHFIPLTLFSFTRKDALILLQLGGGSELHIASLTNTWYGCPRFAVSADNEICYASDKGRLLKIDRDLRQYQIKFKAKVKLEVNRPVSLEKYTPLKPGTSIKARSVLNPRLSPDGRRLVFGAAGHLWVQSLERGIARQISEAGEYSEEAVFSPDGRQIAYVQGSHYSLANQIEFKKDKIRIYDFQSGKTNTLATVGYALGPPSWRPDGEGLAIADWETDRLYAVSLPDGKKELIAEYNWREPRPHFSTDGKSLYFTDRGAGKISLCQLPLEINAEPHTLVELAIHYRSGLVSPNGKWIASRSRMEIWIAPLDAKINQDNATRLLSPEGGDSFAFTPDGESVIYSVGNRVWVQNVESGKREEIPIRLNLEQPTPPPLLLQRVRVLDYSLKDFSNTTSILIESGRIRWIGSRNEKDLPSGTVTLDAGGRFAIPGLFDMHIHGGDQAIFIAYGITSVRNVGDWLAWQNSMADRDNATSDALPRTFYSGDTLRGRKNPYYLAQKLWINDKDDSRSYVNSWKEKGAQFIKAYFTNHWTVQRAIAEEARLQGLPVVGHGLGVEELTKSVIMGYASMEHSHYCYEDVFLMLKLAGTWWTPTLVCGPRGYHSLFRIQPGRLVDEKLRAFISEARILSGLRRHPYNAVSDEASYGRWIRLLACIRKAHHQGVKLLAGTDSPAAIFLPGISLHWELENFVEAGLTPLEVLRIATQQAAEAVSADEDLGSLEFGKLADIVLLDRNPLEDIKNTQSIWRVIKGGFVFDPEKLKPENSADESK